MKTDIFDIKGKKAGTVELPEAVFGLPWNEALMHQVIVSMQANARTNVAHAKTRGEVRGGGKKPWQQKGTGRSRHGSSRSPIWKGGGVTHGPRNEKVYGREIPKKMRAKALFVALSQKMRDGQLLFVDSFGLTAPKTGDAKKALIALSSVKGFEALSGSKKHNLALIASTEKSEAAAKSFRNIGSVSFDQVTNLNPVTVLKYKYIVIENPVEAVNAISKRASKSKLEKVTK
ncbi:MAG: 50S ribosomal protein L4 [Candidatus Pacebacteria bacterium]|nr:50S ribosomal protein L4 [Candidatus Paceibacterota bacterium]